MCVLTVVFVFLQPDLISLMAAITAQSPELVQLLITAGADSGAESEVIPLNFSLLEFA